MIPVNDFREKIVRENLDEFSADYQCVRKAFNAVTAVDAYAAHIYYGAINLGHDPAIVLAREANVTDDTSFRNEISNDDPSFRLLRDLAKANKHAVLTRHNPQVGNSGAVESRSVGWGELPYGCGRYGGGPQLIVKDNFEKPHYVECMISKSVKLLDGYAKQLGLIDISGEAD